MNENTFQIGPIRPPSEANSILLRVTENCPWNQCKFCMLYKGTKFHMRSVAELKREVDIIAEYRDRILSHQRGGKFQMDSLQQEYATLVTDDERMCYQMVFRWMTEGESQAIFLQDANTLVIRPDWLAEVIRHIRYRLPELKRITSYGRAHTLARISEADYKMLFEAGLNRIHSGFETGSTQVLEMIGKGGTQEDQIIGGKRVKDAGIELSIYFMPGVAGKELSKENAIETAKVINEINPDFVRLRTFVLRTGSLMEELRDSGNYTEPTDMEKLLEIRMLLEYVDPRKAHGMLASDHIINLLQNVEGKLDTNLQEMKSYIDIFLALPKLEQKQYQLARRMGLSMDWKNMDYLQEGDKARIKEMANTIVDEKEWEKLLHSFMDRYI